MQSGLPRHRGRVEKQAVTGMGKRAPGQRKYLYMYAADVMAGLKAVCLITSANVCNLPQSAKALREILWGLASGAMLDVCVLLDVGFRLHPSRLGNSGTSS